MAWNTFCPAKINLYLAVTGRRADGFHDLVSLVAPLVFGDTLRADHSPSGADELTCTDASLPVDGANLVLKAAAAFRRRVRMAPPLAFHLDKVVPHGAGLGGGSSDAAGALRILNQSARNLLSPAELSEIAAEVGSDCPLFLHEGPVIIRGRGERVDPLPQPAADALAGLSITLVKPHFGIATAWAYSELARRAHYIGVDDAERALTTWIEACASRNPADPPPAPPIFNSFQEPVFGKYLCFPTLNRQLTDEGLPQLVLSGSGSACFCLTDAPTGGQVAALAEDAFGLGTFSIQTVARQGITFEGEAR